MNENVSGAASFDGGRVLSATNVYNKFERNWLIIVTHMLLTRNLSGGITALNP
jgi:hypothetical protein